MERSTIYLWAALGVLAIFCHEPPAGVNVRSSADADRAAVREALQTAVLVLSQYVEERYATDLLSGETAGVGYLLKDRVVEGKAGGDAVIAYANGAQELLQLKQRLVTLATNLLQTMHKSLEAITNNTRANELLKGHPPRKGWEEYYKLA